MTKKQYQQYQRDVDVFFRSEGITNLSGNGDTFFSWRECDCCGRTPGGDRETADGYNPETKEVQHYDGICADCVYYAEYGQLDDQTMLDMENDTAAYAAEMESDS